MKYLEEINPGDIFVYKNNKYILSSDHKIKQQQIFYMTVSINDGSIRWMDSNSMIEILDLYYRDKEGNILLVKEFDNDKHS